MINLENLFCVCEYTKSFFVKPVNPFKDEGYIVNAGSIGAALFQENDVQTVIDSFQKEYSREFISIPALEIANEYNKILEKIDNSFNLINPN